MKRRNGIRLYIDRLNEWGRANRNKPLGNYKSALRALDREIKAQLERNARRYTREVNEALKRQYIAYKRGGYRRTVHGLKGYRLNDMTPRLRRELKRQTEISLQLIRDNDAKSMDALRNRFINWATNPTKDEREEGLKYGDTRHERMVIRDQSKKLEGNLARIVADEVGAFAWIWKNRKDKRVVGNPAGLYPTGTPDHEDHWHREGKMYLIKDSKALRRGWIRKTKDIEWEDSLGDGRPSQAINCRCWAQYIYSLADIPPAYEGILTSKGRAQRGEA